jgi:uncharacterized membrane protein YccC
VSTTDSSAPAEREAAVPSAWTSFWSLVWRYDRTKISFPVSVRNAVGVALPLVAGLAAGHLREGAVVALGALNVSYSDGTDVFRERARRLFLASVFVSLAILAGAVVAANPVLCVIAAGLAALAAGQLVAFGQTAADIGTVSLVTLIIFTGQALPAREAVIAGLLGLLGALLQSGLALASWPAYRYQPLRRALGEFYAELAKAAQAQINAHASPVATKQSIAAQETLSRYGVDPSDETERYRSLLDQAERIRLSLLALGRSRRRLEREDEAGRTAAGIPLEALNNFLKKAAAVLDAIGTSLSTPPAKSPDLLLPATMNVLAPDAGAGLSPFGLALLEDIRYQTEALGGQLRAALQLARGGVREAVAVPGLAASPAFRERWIFILTTLRSSLTFRSAAFRHAVRLAVAVAICEAIGSFFQFFHFTWLPMTVAIILKPDFSTTYSRGILRLLGTLAGLLLATLLKHWLVPSPWLDIAFVAIFVFILRSYGAANYGVFTTAVSALIVYLFSLSGMPPKEVVEARALQTVAGGAIALLTYWVWPTWEDTGLDDRFASMLVAYRGYFVSLANAYGRHQHGTDQARSEIDRQRLAARLARTNLEASVLRHSAEPRASKGRLRAITAMMASSHRLVHAVMSLETGLERTVDVKARPAFASFVAEVTQTLTHLAAQMRGGKVAAREFPDLRAAYRELAGQGSETVDRYVLVNIETDRIVNSLNTLAEQVRAWQRLTRR